MTCSGILGHVNFEEIALLLIFGPSDGEDKIEVRDSRTGYLIPARYGLGVWPDRKIVGASPPPSSASSGKWPNIKKYTLFPRWACLKIPEIVIFQK